ncbi:hypothetical protein [Sorangium sp. So ce426]|uniref:hypothetical protein n=1 Tax=unclassified Sorangium TaxID=2621164 RepID=UPI003F5B9E5E
MNGEHQRTRGRDLRRPDAGRDDHRHTTWEQVTQLDDEGLERALYGTTVVEPGVAPAEPDCAWIHRERHRPHVTLELLHLEYLRQHPSGLRYTAFCNRYRAWLARRGLVMRQVHVAGEKDTLEACLQSGSGSKRR